MAYRKIFDPEPEELSAPPEGAAIAGPDRRDGTVYVYHDEAITMAVNVALVTSRPLLVSGPPGSGKSSLAPSIATVLDGAAGDGLRWAYAEHVVTPSTRAADLLWRYDAVRRLRDAQAGELARDPKYLQPGVLWRAFAASHEGVRTVVLLDEIDKADPDVPNSLLEVLGNLRFTVGETGEEVTAAPEREPLVVLTTNNERELPRPFLRRCVTLTLQRPGPDRLLRIADAHGLGGDAKLAGELAELLDTLAREAEARGRPAPSAAEYLDALRTCRELGITPQSPVWEHVERATLRKPTQFGDGAG